MAHVDPTRTPPEASPVGEAGLVELSEVRRRVDYDDAAETAGGATSTEGVSVVLLLPTEASHAKRIDAHMAKRVEMLVRRGARRIGLLGVAPTYPLAVRWLPGGIAKHNRQRDAAGLEQRLQALKKIAEDVAASNPSTAALQSAVVHVVAHGDQGTPQLVFDALDALVADREAWGVSGENGSALRVDRVFVPQDSPAAFGSTTQAGIVDAAARARRPAPLTVVGVPELATANSNVTHQHNESARRGRTTVVVFDPDALDPVMPPQLREALALVRPHDAIVLFAPARLPAAGEAVQLSGEDWKERMKGEADSVRAVLEDQKKALEAALTRRGVGPVQVAVQVSQRHHMEGLEATVRTLRPDAIVLRAAFKRQGFLRPVWESWYGAEFDRILRQHVGTDVTLIPV